MQVFTSDKILWTKILIDDEVNHFFFQRACFERNTRAFRVSIYDIFYSNYPKSIKLILIDSIVLILFANNIRDNINWKKLLKLMNDKIQTDYPKSRRHLTT